jgi:hypothetical protein
VKQDPDALARLANLERVHLYCRALLTLDPVDPDDLFGRSVRRYAHRAKALLIDGITDYEAWEAWLACQRAIDRHLGIDQARQQKHLEALADAQRERESAMARMILTAP